MSQIRSEDRSFIRSLDTISTYSLGPHVNIQSTHSIFSLEQKVILASTQFVSRLFSHQTAIPQQDMMTREPHELVRKKCLMPHKTTLTRPVTIKQQLPKAVRDIVKN